MSGSRPWAWPLVPLYAAVLAVKDGLRGVGLLQSRKLKWPVVSIGSLSAGGAGKTPAVIALARLLKQRGWIVDVLSRGYGRRSSDVTMVTSDDYKVFGDEPVLIARTAGVPVWVGTDRFAAGSRAEGNASRELSTASSLARDHSKGDTDSRGSRRVLHLLDDGFQHRQLQRTVNVVLVTAEDLQDVLLPAGNLREPITALRRADVVVVRQEERLAVVPRVRALVREATAVWSIQRTLRFPRPLGVLSAGLRPVAFCAIARPEGFAAMLQDAGCGIVETIAFRDHHVYAMADIEHIVKVAVGLKSSGFVTTEKDEVKLSVAMRERLDSVGPLIVVALVAEFVNPAEVLSDLEERLA